MAYPKRVNAINKDHQLKAIQTHAGFINFVHGKVQKVGLETVLQQYKTALGPPSEYYWLKKAYERVLDFAEKVQLKQMDVPVVDQSTHEHFTVKVEIEDENKAPLEAGNRISQYIEV